MAVVHVTEKNFDEEVLSVEGKVLVDFWAAWCGPCQMLSPIIDAMANEQNNVKICKVNTDESPELTAEYGVMTIPTLILFKDGQEVSRSNGFVTKSEILDMIR